MGVGEEDREARPRDVGSPGVTWRPLHPVIVDRGKLVTGSLSRDVNVTRDLRTGEMGTRATGATLRDGPRTRLLPPLRGAASIDDAPFTPLRSLPHPRLP